MIIARNKGEHLKLGDLNGNQFKLVIRDVKVLLKNEEKRQKFDLQKIVANAKENISRSGFINLFSNDSLSFLNKFNNDLIRFLSI